MKTSLLALLLGTAAAAAGSTIPAMSPPRGHYASLQRLATEAAAVGLPLDRETYPNNPASLARLPTIAPEFIRVPLDEFALPPCPANSSAQTRAELDYLLRLQAQRTSAEGERALYFAPWGYSTSVKPEDANYRAYQANLFQVGRSIGSWFNAQDLPETAQLLHRMWRDANWHVWALKFKYSRIRPQAIDPRIVPLQETPWAAFPSGHSSFAHLLAEFYSELAPEFRDQFFADARAIGHSREIIGVHYPSDTEAGRVFGHQFMRRLLAHPAFAAEIRKGPRRMGPRPRRLGRLAVVA